MGAHRKAVRSDEEIIRDLTTVTDPALLRYKAKLQREFGKYATTAEETQALVAKEMGNKTLSEVLREMRSERP